MLYLALKKKIIKYYTLDFLIKFNHVFVLINIT